MKEFDTYLFDLDGTLIETRQMIIACFRDTFEKFGGPVSVSDDEINQLIGIPYRSQIDRFFGTVDDEFYNRIRQEHMRHQLALFRDRLTLCPGVAEVVVELSDRGKKLGIVTSRTLESGGPFLEWFGLKRFFPVIVTPDHTKAHKPHPGPVLLALERLGAVAAETLFVGDAVFDIQAGAAAGTKTCFTAWSPAALNGFRADYTVSDMRDLLSF